MREAKSLSRCDAKTKKKQTLFLSICVFAWRNEEEMAEESCKRKEAQKRCVDHFWLFSIQ